MVYQLRKPTHLNRMHGSPMLVDKTKFGIVICNQTNFIGLRNHLVIGQLSEYQFFSSFHWSTSDTPPASQCITVQSPISETLCGPCIAARASKSWFFSEATEPIKITF